MDQYKRYLATQVINEGQIVTYRSLSRALKVHVNLAKQMLYSFHKTQTAKNPNSVHATYLVSGIKKSDALAAGGTKGKDGEDTVMDSSPFPSSWAETPDRPEPKIVKTITLVKEENLEELKDEFAEVGSIHVYSIQPNSPQDMFALATVNLEVFKNYASEDPLLFWKQYGTTQNPNVTRRSGTEALIGATIATSKAMPLASKASAAPSNSVAPSANAEQAKPRRSVASKDSKSTSTAAPPKLKSSSSGKGDIFASFSKASAKPKSELKQPDKPKVADVEDESMKDVFDEDNEDEEQQPTVEDAEKVAASRKARKDREARLRQMMDDDDEPMADAPPEGTDPDAEVVVEPEETDDTAALDIKPKPEGLEQEKEILTVSGGRRRGRRRVTKKVTVKDEEGYLVTTEEPAWESFSEEEPVLKKPKPIPASTTGKKKSTTKGQGNIMSFFGKK